MFSLIAAIGKKNEIGKNGKLVFNIKDDMKFFRETTTGHKVLMGLNTWNSLPHKLKGRHNIVVSYGALDGPDEVITDLEDYIKQHKDSVEEIFVIGGGMIYARLLPYAKNLYLTEIDASDGDADVFFPIFDKKKYNMVVLKKGNENGVDYTISKYTIK